MQERIAKVGVKIHLSFSSPGFSCELVKRGKREDAYQQSQDLRYGRTRVVVFQTKTLG